MQFMRMELTICEFSLISMNSFCQEIVGVFTFFFRFSLMLATRSACFFRAAVDRPVVNIPTSILPDNGSVADCFSASRCNLFQMCVVDVIQMLWLIVDNM